MDVSLSEAEYRRIYAESYALPLPESWGGGDSRRDTFFRCQVRKAIEANHKRKTTDIAPHDDRRTRHNVVKNGELLVLEIRK